jgi:endonuclease/exonuclease/phosphatase family metal-dependent hydrolase
MEVQALRFLTYNVWFEPHNFALRTVELLKIIQEQNADFVCLQEVTGNFLASLLTDPFIRSTYYVSGNYIASYGVIML